MGNRAIRVLCTIMLAAGLAACGDNLPGQADAPPCQPVDDGNDCTDDLCRGDVPVHDNFAAGTACATGVCDGEGACVGCLEDDDCTTGDQICDEKTTTCVDPTCDDGEQDGDETDVDCGGSCAPTRTCADGDGCAIPGDCTSGVCTGMICQAPRCGDGVMQGTEACDDGNGTNGDGCDDGAGGTCRPTGCGNGVVSGTEACDDGNAMNDDGCDNNCTVTACGNGIQAGAEQCDEGGGDQTPGDGCSATCQVEAGWMCTGMPSTCTTSCGDGIRAGTEACDDAPPAESGDGCSLTCTVEPGFMCTGSPSVCTTTCGDGIRAGLEACDDGGTMSGNGCSATCTVEPGFTCTGSPSTCTTTCGDGIRAGAEACDDGGTMSGNGCSATCTVEPGFMCVGSPSICTTSCGDGIRAGAEACDDPPPAEDGDGCSLTCTVEPGFMCTGSPSTCTTTCGDGVRAGAEACDDGNTTSGNGCSATCTVEPGFTCTGSPSVCTTTCGDGVRAGAEACDDGNTINTDGCSSVCATEPGFTCTGSPSTCTTTCGDGIRTGTEACDDGDTSGGDGCSATCTVESGFTCAGSTPTVCTSVCGDGQVVAGEACDDGGTAAGDGCSAVCTVEPGYTCIGSPSVCSAGCGDGIVAGAEQCDDGNNTGLDGCSATCTTELGFTCVGSPSICVATCGDGVRASTEACDDGALVPGDGCSALCTVEPGFTCTGSPSTCVTTCGDGIRTGTEACDDGGTTAGDGCSATCTTEPGFTCTGSPSTCVTTCGDGVRAGTEQCDQGNVVPGDGCSATCTTEPGFTCTGSPSTCVTTCGDGTRAGTEQCDDGNTAPNDGCSATCTLECGNGTLQGAEQCDDGNTTSGDGCSATCQIDIGCPVGETAVVLTNNTSFPIPDNNLLTGITSPVNVTTTGAVTKVIAYVGNLTHTFDGDVDMYLVAPTGRARDLSTDNGVGGDNFVRTFFDDAAATAITAAAALPPYTGRFRPEQSLSTTAGTDYLASRAAGTWALRIFDDANGDTGTLTSWTLTMCVNPALPFCGDGLPGAGEECDDGNLVDTDGCNNGCRFQCGDGELDAGEQCDDGNHTSGDGCSATCTIDITCAAGELAVTGFTSPNLSIPDNTAAGVSAPIALATPGAITRAVVTLTSLTHASADQLDIFLTGPTARERELSTDNGSTNPNYRLTVLDDAATTLITATAAVAPFNGRFRPETSISTTAGTDFRGLNGAGTWNLRVADDASLLTGTLDAWGLALCVNPTVAFCGNTVVDAGEECDDGNTNNTDLCSNTCRIVDGCGDGNLDAGEQCDDDNLTSGDGCSALCQVEITCAAGEVPAIVSNGTPLAIPDNVLAGVSSPVTVVTPGAVTKAIVVIGSLTHTNDADIDAFLVHPSGVRRELTTDNGGTGDHYVSTILDDAATTLVTSGTAPFNGRFRPEQSLSTTAGTDFRNLGGAGTWNLNVADDAAAGTGTLDRWTLALCVNPSVPFCGNSTTDAGEECDDGNFNDNDACNNSCRFPCGDGGLDPGEQCDDGNHVPGDGCSATCTPDISCGAAEIPVIVSNTTSTAIPDTFTGLLSTVGQPMPGLVRKAIVTMNVTFPNLADIDVFLHAPNGVQRELVSERAGANFTATSFSDAAATAITAGAAPFTGTWRGTQTISDAAGFGGQAAMGNWMLHIAKDTSGRNGTLDSWTLAVCIDPSMSTVCGNGTTEPGEQCDDANVVAGDGCSASCQIELTCATGVPVIVPGGGLPLMPPDANTTGITSNAAVTTVGTVRKAIVVISSLSHQYQSDLDISLVSPMGTNLDLTSDNGGTNDDFVTVILDDAAAASITTMAATPGRGRFRPEVALTAVNGQAAAGNWGLKVVDDTNADVGVLSSWWIGLCVE